ncbi:MAG: glycoside hydrolase family 2 TIM barrel-domain containing protein [Capsulimonadales bacterium]|nr:glycoside hydrolase family 2 TIM barrel-domain containing protein [Capsulimonadales bacterium]
MRTLYAVFRITLLLYLFASPLYAQTTPPFVWVEGENTAAVTLPDAVVKRGGWGKKEFLSGETWLHISVEEKDVAKTIPDGGAIVRYAFDVPQAGNYAVWDRIGYEFVRSPFAWRIDSGDWKTISPDALTTDLMSLETWNEVAWLPLGNANLTAGRHTLEIRLDRTKDEKGNLQRVLYASDALCLIAGTFTPNSRFRPGESGRTEADRAAETRRFELPEATSDGTRVALPLKGDWEICRNDENLPPADIAVPMQDFPANPIWRAIPVPSDKNVSRPDLTFAHRVWYRTRVNVPASHAGRSFVLTFPRNNLNTTVYVNGVYCGFNKNPNAPFDIDITKGMKPGQTNEVWVGIRDAWYGYSNNPKNPMVLRRMFNLPLSFVGNGFQRLAYPIWHAWESGIVQTPVLTSVGGTYLADIFIQPEVARKRIRLRTTFLNNLPEKVHGKLNLVVIDAKTGKDVAASRSDFDMTGGSSRETTPGNDVVVNIPEPKLWWPEPNPQLYRLRVSIFVEGKNADVSETTFGFREWGSRGKDFTLNGVVWHGWADLNAGETPAEFLANYRKANQRFFRLSGYAQGGPNWRGLTPAEALDFADRNGMVVRRSGDLDGEAIGYMAIEDDPDLKALYKSEIKMDLMKNWRDQMVQQVRAERNHPSIQLWSVENEWLYINCINLYGDRMDEFEREVKVCMDAVREADPTRLVMTDGGGAGKDNLFPVHGDHYVFDASRPGAYPALAYEANPNGGGRGRWKWDQQRPRYLGEDFFATGINPFDYAYFGGEETFIGKVNTRRAVGIVQTMLTEGYRWAEYGAWHFWLGSESGVGQYKAFADLAVFCRQWDRTFPDGARVTRTLGIFNDRFRDEGPITLTQTLTVDGKIVRTDRSTHTVPPGTSKKFDVLLALPRVERERAEGTWTLTLTQGGKERYRDVRPISILRAVPANRSPLTLARQGGSGSPSAPLVFDPQGQVVAYLTARKMPFRRVTGLNALPTGGQLLILGRDALTPEESASTRLAAWAAAGGRVLVLEQKTPLRYQGMPAAMEFGENEGRTAFLEEESHPVFRGLRNEDFFTWGPDEVVYRNAYEKPTRGAKSLLQCDARLARTALAEVPVGRGLLLVCQARVGELLGKNAVADRLFRNLVGYATGYRQEFRPVLAATPGSEAVRKALRAAGVRFTETNDPLKTLNPGGIAVVAATPDNLKRLAANPARLTAFHKGGGWLFLTDLTPEGLPEYNRVVGFDHMIRPFRRERVTFPAKRDPLTAGLSVADIVLSSGERINGYTDDVYLASDVFRYVLDYDEVAPFAQLPNPSYWGHGDANNDHNPYNIVNGFNSDDSWQLIFSMWAGPGGKPEVPMTLPRAQTLTEVEWQGNAFYYPTKEFEIRADNGAKAVFRPRPDNSVQAFPIRPALTGKEFLVRITGWVAAKEPAVVGIDNLRLKAQRSPEFYRTTHPLLNIGALMRYDRGSGGIVLCNILFQDTEAVPENLRKKRNILATLLRNLKAPIGGGATVIAGAALNYAPIEIGKWATQFRDERGWFGDRAFTFKDLPTGRQTFAGVPFSVYRFATSPVPDAIMLKGDGVPGNLPESVREIPIGRKADALFFLQTARIDQRRNRDEIRDRKPVEMARYVVTYEDGEKAVVPIRAEEDVDDYRQESPRAIPGAQIGWIKRYDGTPYSAVAYVQQWNNPRPSVAIRSVDLEYGADRRGVPVLLALTAATAR